MHAELAKLSQDTQLAIGHLFQNDQSLKTGLDAAEFNLRTHQKVINAVTVDVLDYVINRDPPGLPTRIDTVTVEEPMTDSHPAHTRVSVDWVKYHGYVEAEMKALAEEARKADLVNRTEQVKDLEDSGKLQKFKEHIYETIEKSGEDQEARRARADSFFNDVYAQIALIKVGKEYSGAKLDVLLRMIAEDEKHSAGTTAPQEEIGTLAESPAEADEDTNVFGG